MEGVILMSSVDKTKAVTNCDTPILEFNCKCGYPITAEYYPKKHRYLGIR